jgi:hypothetical protein
MGRLGDQDGTPEERPRGPLSTKASVDTMQIARSPFFEAETYEVISPLQPTSPTA